MGVRGVDKFGRLLATLPNSHSRPNPDGPFVCYPTKLLTMGESSGLDSAHRPDGRLARLGFGSE
jgi:hypothetical protein